MKRRVCCFLLTLLLIATLTSCENMMETAFKRQMSKSRASMLTDGNLHVVLVGSGGPMPNKDRISTSVAVMAGGQFILVDTGGGSARSANLLNLPMSDLSAVFLTHFHSDHIADLGEINMYSWVQGRKQRLPVYGPEGVEKVVAGFTMAYALDSTYRTAHHGEGVAPANAAQPIARTITIDSPDQAQLFFDQNGLKVWAFLVDHFPAEPAVGYRFEYKGNVVVLSGDTKKVANLARNAKNADLFVCQGLDAETVSMGARAAKAANRPALAKILTDIQDYQMTPVEAAAIARDAQVKKLVFYHIVPPITNFILKRRYLKGVDDIYHGDVELGEDGMSFVLKPQ